ncbi:MAG: hypothetical protein MJK15_10400 [Colwellia sp.]|nr:hypothetical protein [Colwellia sp.]
MAKSCPKSALTTIIPSVSFTPSILPPATVNDLIDSVSQVTNIIAHDLRTPLSRIRIAVEDSIDNDSALNQDDQWKEKLLDEIDNVMHTLNAMLELSRLEKGVQHKPNSCVDISALCQDVFELVQPLTGDKDQQFIFIDNTSSERLSKPILADANLLFRAIYNIVKMPLSTRK